MLTYATHFNASIISIHRMPAACVQSTIPIVLPKVPEGCPSRVRPDNAAMLQLEVVAINVCA